jgi:ketosteroid isomerase-like protein
MARNNSKTADEVRFELHDLSITVGEGAAFATSLNHITGMRTSGEQADVWVRATIGFAKKDRGWKATHEHFSVPFYMDFAPTLACCRS